MSSDNPMNWMWAEACDMLDRADRLHRQFFQLTGSHPHGPVWEPPVDVFETERMLWILAALPGVTPDKVSVSVEGRVLSITGERPMPAAARGAAIHRLELPYGRLERHIELPAGRFELTHRELANGCLALGLQKLD
jgi:HSP20 family protein